jgi:hypothetical protein
MYKLFKFENHLKSANNEPLTKFPFSFSLLITLIACLHDYLFSLGPPSNLGNKPEKGGWLVSTGANPIKIIMPTPKFWSWRNYKNSLFQSYKAVFLTQNHAKRHFLP